MKLGIVAVVASLLTVSCTGTEPKPEPEVNAGRQIRALDRVEKISTPRICLRFVPKQALRSYARR